MNWEVGGSRMGKEAGLQWVDKGRYEQESRKTRKLYNGKQVIGSRYMGEYLSKNEKYSLFSRKWISETNMRNY